MPAQTVFKLRRDTAANWTSTNPVLASGEPGLETDTKKIKYGDGTTAWTSLAYAGATVSGTLVDGAVVRLDGTSGSLQSSGLFISDANVFAKPAAETQFKSTVTGSNSGTDRNYTFDLSLSNYFSATITQEYSATAPSALGSTTSADFGAAASGSITLPAGMVPGDVVIVAIGSDGGQAIASSSGWFAMTSGSQGTEYLSVFIKTMGAIPDTGFSFTGTSTATTGVATAYRNAGATTAVLAPTSGSGMPNPAAVTTTVNNSLVVAIGGLDDDNVATVTAPAGYSNLVSKASTAGGQTVMMASKVVATAGVEDPAAFGGTGTDDWAAYTIVIAPTLYSPKINITAATAITTSAGSALGQTVILDLTYTSGTVTWDTDISFGDNGAPILGAGINYLVSLTTNNGTNYKAVVNSGY